MANTMQYNDMHGKRVPLMWNWFYLTHLRLLVGGLEPNLFHTILICYQALILGEPQAQWSLIEETVAWMLDWQAVWAIPFFIRRAYRGFGVSE